MDLKAYTTVRLNKNDDVFLQAQFVCVIPTVEHNLSYNNSFTLNADELYLELSYE